MSDVRRPKTHVRSLQGSTLQRASSQLLKGGAKLFCPSSPSQTPELPRTTRENPSRRRRLARPRDQRSPELNISRKRYLTEDLLLRLNGASADWGLHVCEHVRTVLAPKPLSMKSTIVNKKCDSFLSRCFNHQLLGNSRGSWQKTPGQCFNNNLKQMLFVFKKIN